MSGSTGETPNWTAGYVPSANEWNSWWGRKVDMSNVLFTGAPFLSLSGGFMTGPLHLVDNPTTPSQAVNKAYADTKMSGTGGNISGDMGIDGSLTAKNLYAEDFLLINKFNEYEWYMTVAANGDHFQTYRPGWSDVWVSAGGARHWIGANDGLMSLDGGGNLSVKGTLYAGTISSAGNLFADQLIAANGVFGKALGLGSWVFYNDGVSLVQEFTPGWSNKWAIAGGERTWVNGGVPVMSLTGGGVLNVTAGINTGQLNSGNNVAANGAVTAAGGSMALAANVSGRVLQMDPNWAWHWSTTTGDMTWIGPLPAPFTTFFQMRTSDKNCINLIGGFGGIVDYFVGSDTRLKTDMVPASCGLADILKLEPIEFTRIDHDGSREIGFAAQALREVIPLAVRPFDKLDTDDPILGITMTPIIVALVNGMKELAAEVAALKAGK
jgi:hypothetical protein